MPEIRRSPGSESRAASTPPSADSKFTAYRRQDGYQAPTVEDRAIAAAIAVLEQHGYGIAMRCLDCGHGIFSKSSLARLRGPKCAARAEAVAR